MAVTSVKHEEWRNSNNCTSYSCYLDWFEEAEIKVFNSLKRLIAIRKKQKAFHPNAKQEILNLGQNLFGLIRKAENQTIVTLVNLTGKNKHIDFPTNDFTCNYDLISDKKMKSMDLAPYQCIWLTNKIL